jgi:hypothetical protein
MPVRDGWPADAQARRPAVDVFVVMKIALSWHTTIVVLDDLLNLPTF